MLWGVGTKRCQIGYASYSALAKLPAMALETPSGCACPWCQIGCPSLTAIKQALPMYVGAVSWLNANPEMQEEDRIEPQARIKLLCCAVNRAKIAAPTGSWQMIQPHVYGVEFDLQLSIADLKCAAQSQVPNHCSTRTCLSISSVNESHQTVCHRYSRAPAHADKHHLKCI